MSSAFLQHFKTSQASPFGQTLQRCERTMADVLERSVPASDALTELLPIGGWQQDAACRQTDPELFFSNHEDDRDAAIALCGTCPVRMQCLEHALASREGYGIWGGTDEQERRRILRRQRQAS